jgi:hypothetical protein
MIGDYKQSWVQPQHPPPQWNLRDGRCSETKSRFTKILNPHKKPKTIKIRGSSEKKNKISFAVP